MRSYDMVVFNRGLKVDGLRKCNTCGMIRPLSDFHLRGQNNHQQWCKGCNNKIHCTYIKKKRLEEDIDFLVVHKLQASRRDAKKRGHMSCNITKSELRKLFRTSCEICSKECGGKIHLDHCHKTGNFRGFLCSRCNLIIGHGNDDPDYINKVSYWLRDKQALSAVTSQR